MQKHKTNNINVNADYSIFVFFHSLNFFQIWIHAMREGPPWVGVE